MKIIFIVDDNDTNLMAAKTALEGAYKTFAMPSAARMLKLAEQIMPDLILLDVDMPEMDGFEAMRALKSNPRLKSIPVIFLTAMSDTETETHGFEMGALDFIYKPFSPPVLIRRIETHIETGRLIKEALESVRKMHEATISVLADVVESRDKVTGGHIERTQIYLRILLSELSRTEHYTDEMAKWDLSLLLPSAQLHDVGKIIINELILNKPGKLTKDEFELVKRHCAEGERIVEQIISKVKDDGFLWHAKRFAGYHHEKWDGSGYPRGLRGDAIPLEARLMAIVDVYDALTSERPYKKAFSHQEAVMIIEEGKGTHFDPVLADAFATASEQFSKTAERCNWR